MSRRRIKLEIGKFYYLYWGSQHPAYIFLIDKNHKTYFSIKTGTTRKKGMKRIKPISPNHKNNYVHKRPIEGTKKDYGNKELKGLNFDKDDREIIEQIKKEKPIRTARAKMRYKK